MLSLLDELLLLAKQHTAEARATIFDRLITFSAPELRRRYQVSNTVGRRNLDRAIQNKLVRVHGVPFLAAEYITIAINECAPNADCLSSEALAIGTALSLMRGC